MLIQVNVFNSWGNSLLLLRKTKQIPDAPSFQSPMSNTSLQAVFALCLRQRALAHRRCFLPACPLPGLVGFLEGSTGISQRPLKPLPSHIPELATLFFYRVLISTCSESSNAHLQAVHAVWSEIRKYIRFGILAGPLRFARMVIANAVSA